MTTLQKNIKKWIGKVISNKSDKTAVVEIVRSKTHPLYKKKYSTSKKFHIHDEKNLCQVGDIVEFNQSKPISKTKHFQLNKIINKEIS